MRVLELVFWLGTLIGWCMLVGYGIRVLECVLDRLLDKWFDREPNDHDDNPWPNYEGR